MRGCLTLILLLSMMAMPFVFLGTTFIALVVLCGIVLLLWGMAWGLQKASEYLIQKAEDIDGQEE